MVQTDRDSRTGRYRSQPVEHGPFPVRSETGDLIGQVWATPYGWFAAPRGSQVQALWSATRAEAVATVERLGSA